MIFMVDISDCKLIWYGCSLNYSWWCLRLWLYIKISTTINIKKKKYQYFRFENWKIDKMLFVVNAQTPLGWRWHFIQILKNCFFLEQNATEVYWSKSKIVLYWYGKILSKSFLKGRMIVRNINKKFADIIEVTDFSDAFAIE